MTGTAAQKPPEQAPAPSEGAGSPAGQQQGGASPAALPQDAPAVAAAAAASSDDAGEPGAAAAVKAEPGAAEDEARRSGRRDKQQREQEAAQRWELQRRLADISADVEWLAREVRSRLRLLACLLATGLACAKWALGWLWCAACQQREATGVLLLSWRPSSAPSSAPHLSPPSLHPCPSPAGSSALGRWSGCAARWRCRCRR